jgi:hypothetical protein
MRGQEADSASTERGSMAEVRLLLSQGCKSNRAGDQNRC